MNNRGSLPQQKPTKVKATKVVKGSVLFPASLHRRIEKDATKSRRSFSSQVVAMVEKGLEAPT
jgi:hypothetical protein